MSPNPVPTPFKTPASVVVLTGGGSGGHITPLLSLAHALKLAEPGCRVVYVGLKGDRVEGLQKRYRVFDEVYYVASGKFRRYHGQSNISRLVDLKTLILNGRDLFKVLAGLHSAEKLIRKIKPDVVFSKGGYGAVPVGLAARLCQVPIITHDSDSVPGLANRIIGRWAKVHATGMPADHSAYPKASVVYTGIPLDERIAPVSPGIKKGFRAELDLPASALVLLATGGGQGSKQINDLVLAIAPELLAENANLYIIHITGGAISGQSSLDQIRQAYKKSLSAADYKRLIVLSFTSDFYKYSGAADLIITRAGATAMAEFGLQAKPCIVIPSAALSGGHQLKNAQQLKASAAAEVLPADVSARQLLKSASRLLSEPSARDKLATSLSKHTKPDAAEALADIILDQARNNRP